MLGATRPPLIAFLVIAVVVIVIGMLVSVAMIMAAVKVYNAIAGGRSSKTRVPEPSFGKALAIALILFVIGLFSRFCGAALAVSIGQATNASIAVVNVGAILINVSFYVINASALFTALLPTTFPRAILVAICNTLLLVALAIVILLPFLLIASFFQ